MPFFLTDITTCCPETIYTRQKTTPEFGDCTKAIKDQCLRTFINIKTMKNSFWLFGSHHWVITDPHNTNLEYDQVEKRSKPGVKTPSHIHGGYTELVYVIEGQMTVHTKEESITLSSGQHFFIPKGIPH